MMLPNITYADVIYIPRHFYPINEEVVCGWNATK
jgi:hypothetical protein